MLKSIAPILPSRNIAATEAFYARLGFSTAYRDHAYLLLERDDVEVHFFLDENHTPQSSNHGAYLRPSGVDALSSELSALDLPRKGIPRFEPAAAKPWGMKELIIIDPDGNLIRAGEAI